MRKAGFTFINGTSAAATVARQPISTFICPSCTLPTLTPEAKYNAAGGGPYGLGCSGTTAAMLGPCIESSTVAIRKLRGRPLREILDGTSKTFLPGANVIDIDIDL